MSPLRIIFMGTAEIACASLAALAQRPEFKPIAVVTQPDRPKGRDLKLQPSPVKVLAARLGVPVLQPHRARDEKFVQELRQLQPDLITVAAYGQILPPAILELPRFGCLNVHASLLPKYRGASPIQSAILHDESETGITIMRMDAGLDTGDILTQQATTIAATDDAETLHDRLANLGADLLVRTIPDYVAGKIKPRTQPAEGVSYAPKITKQNGRLDWTQPARTLWNRIRAFTPWPGAFTYLAAQPKPHLLKIWQADVVERPGRPGEIMLADKSGIIVACGGGALRILKLQLEGGRRLTAQEFLAGHELKPSQRLD
ncbi:MAG: methionyl-tRNA formyltransferase [Verrucomicrobia bacterium]|nr:methionyl-tRNA formyltransferase [Verrucomicrobiota bacterium]